MTIESFLIWKDSFDKERLIAREKKMAATQSQKLSGNPLKKLTVQIKCKQIFLWGFYYKSLTSSITSLMKLLADYSRRLTNRT